MVWRWVCGGGVNISRKIHVRFPFSEKCKKVFLSHCVCYTSVKRGGGVSKFGLAPIFYYSAP